MSWLSQCLPFLGGQEKLKVKKKRKEKIPVAIRNAIWATYVGKDIAHCSCPCCGLHQISSTCFSAGHIQSEDQGGKCTLDNLLPICFSCNSSCGTNNLLEFMKVHQLDMHEITQMKGRYKKKQVRFLLS